MKHIPKKAIGQKAKPILIKIDPRETDAQMLMPKIEYEVYARVETQEVFKGMIIPLPKVLVYYLTHIELLIVAVIIEETNNKGICTLTVKEIAKKFGVSNASISNALYTLRKISLLVETPNGKRGTGKVRTINYEAIQRLNDLMEGEDISMFTRIRKATKKTDIMHLTKEDLAGAYNHLVLPPNHDPAEEEEYD